MIASDFISMCAYVPQCRELKYTADRIASLGTNLQFNNGELSVISHTYEDGVGIITLDGVVREINGNLLFSTSYSVNSIYIPPTIIELGNLNASVSEVHIYDLARWLALDFGYSSSGVSYGTAPTTSNILSDAKLYMYGELLEDIIVPDTVTRIGTAVMMGAQIKSVTIPESVTSISSFAFFNYKRTIKIYMEGLVPPAIGRGTHPFSSYSSYYMKYTYSNSIYVPESALDSYKEKWPDYESVIHPNQ